MVRTYSEIAGHVGVAGVLGSYLALASGTVSLTTYYALGFPTAALLTLHGVERGSRPTVVLNVVWFVISAVGIVKALL